MTDLVTLRPTCPVCQGAWEGRVPGKGGVSTRKCGSCGFMASTLKPAIRDAELKSVIDEDMREKGLRDLRSGNFRLLLDRAETLLGLSGRRLLDVGCAHGWFLEEASRRGMVAMGIEPDEEVAQKAKSAGLNVRVGFFPDALSSNERFSLITFNDVLEHLPNPDLMIAAAASHLESDGLVAVNIPLSTGFFFRAATLLDQAGIHAPARRMWQQGMPSPHISYFTQAQLLTMFERHGLVEVHRSSLPTLGRRGLWARLRHVNPLPLPMAAVVWGAVAALRPAIDMLPPDIGLQFFGRPQLYR